MTGATKTSPSLIDQNLDDSNAKAPTVGEQQRKIIYAILALCIQKFLRSNPIILNVYFPKPAVQFPINRQDHTNQYFLTTNKFQYWTLMASS
jgi:hypothetical protein